MAVSFIGVGNRRKPLTITVTVKHNQIMFIEYTPLKEGFELIIVVAIFTDCICSCIFNYRTSTTDPNTHAKCALLMVCNKTKSKK